MSTPLDPIHVGQVRGVAVRFFKAPNDAVALPWHAFSDLLSAAGLSRHDRRTFLSMVQSGPFQDDVRTVKTSAGPVMIAPHFVFQGTIGALKQVGLMPKDDDFESEFCMAGVSACEVLHAGLSPGERFERIITMGRRHLGREDEV